MLDQCSRGNATSGLSVKKLSIPAASKVVISRPNRPAAFGSVLLRYSSGRNWFSCRNVQPVTDSPAACASAITGVGADSRPSASRGIITFLHSPTPSAYRLIFARPAGVTRSA